MVREILFLDQETPIKVEFKRLSFTTVEITGENLEVNTSGFRFVDDLNPFDKVFKYENYTTLYKKLDNGFVLSNNGSVYKEPEPVPEEAREKILTMFKQPK